jgi:hypothetical protein
MQKITIILLVAIFVLLVAIFFKNDNKSYYLNIEDETVIFENCKHVYNSYRMADCRVILTDSDF